MRTSSFFWKTVQFFRGVVVVNIASQVFTVQPVGSVLDSPQDLILIKGEADFISDTIGKHLAVKKVNGQGRFQ